MDKGAHFYKCDFQVHTPRDQNWSGEEAVTPEERKCYAEELIRACRRKNIDAIAITDHHDFTFFTYIKKAAEDEIDESGQLVPIDKRIIVFPGIELTLTAPSCQALLLLDAGFPENLLQSVLTALSITPIPPTDSKLTNVERIPQTVVADLTDLYKKLNSHQYLKGRFIVLPNVSESGYGTMLRSGFANYYKTMPCVGGYIDGAINQLGVGNLGIIKGKNRDYGYKAIGIFQTSDNRKRNHDDLGKHTTRVKWSEPTAEALRQACLAKESRMSHNEPDLPNLWITSIRVSNSKFMGRVEIELNQQYNAIIGGRGTGKSTILEYLRWGLCDQPVDNFELDIGPVQIKRKKLIEDTLQKFDGEMYVTFLLNKIKHIIKRNSKTQEILLKIGDADFINATEQEIRNLLPIQAYSQKQLSSVGVRIEELKRFVQLPIKKEFDQIQSNIHDTSLKVQDAYGQLIRKKEIEAEIAKNNTEIISLRQQLVSLREDLKGLSEDDQLIIAQKSKYDNEEHIIESLKNWLEQSRAYIESLSKEIGDGAEEQDSSTELQNPQLIKEIQSIFTAKIGEIKRQINALIDLFGQSSLEVLNEKISLWEENKTEFNKKYEAAKAKAKVNQQKLKQIHDTEKRIRELDKVQIEKRNSIIALGNPETSYKEFRTKWDELHNSKIETIDGQCQQFTSLSNGLIKADITKSIDIDLLKQKLKLAFSGMNIKESKVDALCQCILSSPDAITTRNDILNELEKLVYYTASGTSQMSSTPLLDRCGLIESEKTRIAAALNWEKWLDLSLAELEFNPVFYYCTNQDTKEYINFADASAGQQATALLTVLLNQEGTPLIIDQPEDDVDSKLIKDIVEQIWDAKRRRQLIFASHNANFVVNGDAELVICCDYVRAGDQTGGQIKAVGAIDNVVIREEITLVTEGGKEAFKLRMEKYGF